MQEGIKNLAARALETWRTLEKKQKIQLILVVALLAIVLVVTVFIATRPTLVSLSKNEDFATQMRIMQALTDAGIYNTSNRAGTEVFVNEKDHTAARMYLTQNNIPRPDYFTLDDVFENSGMSTSETLMNASLRRTLESQIEQSLLLLSNVMGAKVTLNLAGDSIYFWDQSRRSTAAVLITVPSNVSISREESESMARFVAASVSGLSVEDVQITDQLGRSIFDGSSYANDSGHAARSEAEQMREASLISTIKASIGPMYPDVKVITNLVFDTDFRVTESVTYSPSIEGGSTGMLARELAESSTMRNASQGDVPGLEANDNVAPDYMMGDGETSEANSRSTDREWLVNTQQSRIETTAVGTLRPEESSVAGYAYRDRTITEESARRENLLVDMTWERYKEENSEAVPVQVDEAIIEGLRVGTGINALTLLAFEKPLFVDAEVTEIRIEQIIILVILALIILLLAYGLIRNSQPDEITEIEPELSVEDLLVSTRLEETDELNEIERMKSLELKESETKRQVEKFVNEKPEAVAQLLRNWLNDEWE